MGGGKLLGRLLTSSALWRLDAVMGPDGGGTPGSRPFQSSRMVALEPRVLFDAAMSDTYDHGVDGADHGDAAPDSGEHEALVAALLAGEPVAPAGEIPGQGAKLAFIDTSIAGFDEIIAAIGPGVEVHLVTDGSDGVAQMADVLAGRNNVSAVHIISHGSSGALSLGAASLTAASIQGTHADDLAAIAAALTADADILIYGCDFASGAAGQEAVALLASATGADVAASTDLTGAAALGGDWVLESLTGAIDSEVVTASDWDGTLTKTVINAAGGTAADGSDGIRIHVMTNGQYQITYHGANQFYSPGLTDAATGIFNGIYLAVGSTVAGPGTTSGGAEANQPGQFSGDVTFRELSQTTAGSGTSADPYRVTTTMFYDANGDGAYQAASDFQLQVVTQYVYPNAYMQLNVTVTPPPTNALPVKFYHTIDTYLAGGDNGPAFSLPQNLAQTNDTVGNPSLVAVRKDPGGPNDSFVGFAEVQGGREFDHWYSALYSGANLYNSGLNNGGDIVNTWNTNPVTDNGVAVQFTLGAANTPQSWSYLISLSSEATIDLDADNSSGATGSAYSTTYTTGSGATIAIADADAHISNVTGDIQQVRATLGNAQAGDSLTVNPGALPAGVIILSQTASQIVLGASPSPQTEATFDLALQALGFTTTSSSISARTVNFAVTNELGIEGLASASTIGINQPPNAQDDAFTVAEDGTLVGSLFANNGNGADSDAESDPFTLTAINGAAFTVGVPNMLANGVLTVTNAATGAFSFVPNANYNGPASFAYTITDSDGGTDTATASITVSPVNDAPVIDLDGPLPVSDGTLPASPPDNAWQVALYGGHFGVAGSIDPNSIAESGAPGTPTLHGVGYAPQGSIFFNDPDITILENPRDSLTAAGFSYAANPVNGDYVPSNGTWSMVMSRTLTEDATITVGAPGQYFDDHAELYINGTLVDAIIGWYPSLPGGEVITYAASAGDVVEIRLTNVGGLGGFNVSLNTPEQPNDLDHAVSFTEGDTPVPVTLQTRADAADVENDITSLVISAGGVTDGAAEHVVIAGQDFDLATTSTQTATVGGTAVTISYNAGTQAFTVTNAVGPSTPMPQADLDALLRDITYENTSQDPTAGDRTLTFVATDSGGATSAPALSTITVIPVNDPPVATDDVLGVPEDGTLATNILTANGIDTDPDGDTLSVVSASIDTDGDGDQDPLPLGTATPIIVGGNPIGTLTLTATGDLTFIPAANYNGPVPALTYTMSDGSAFNDTASVAISVTAVNDPPVIDLDSDNSSGAPGADFVTTYVENAPGVTILDPAGFVLNDVDSAISEIVVTLTDGRIGDTINFPSVLPGGISAAVTPLATLTAPGTMTLTLTGTGATTAADWQSVLASITFLPSTNDVHNPDPADRHITVQAWDDSNATSNLATATIQVTPQNDPPTLDLDDDNSTGNSGNAYLGYTENGAPVALHSNIVTTDLDDTSYESATIIHTNPQPGDQLLVNGVPVAAGDSGSVNGIAYAVSTNGSGQLVVSFSGSAAVADYDAALQSLSFASSSENPSTVQRDITFQLSDGTDNSPLRHAYVSVTAVNDPPVGSPIPQQAGQDAAALAPLDASSFFTDPDSSTLTYSLAPGAPSWLSINPATGVITGTPPHDASTTTNGGTPGIWDVTVIAQDGGTPNLSDSVSFTYAISNPPPVAQDDTLASSEGTVLTGQNVFANNGNGADSDPDGDSFSVSAVAGSALNVGAATVGSAGGLFTIAPDGTFTFADNGQFEDLGAGETRATSISYQIADSDGGTATATVTVTVTGTNDAPAVAAPLADISGNDADVVVGLDAAAAFADADASDTLSYSATGLPAGLSIDPVTGIISGTIDPSASQNGNTGAPAAGVYTVVVTADDGHGGTVTDTFTYNVSNPPPVAQDDDLAGNEDTPVTGLDVLANNGNGVDSDPDGDALQVSEVNGLPGNVGVPVAGSTGGLFTLGGDGSLSFDPNGDFGDLAVGETRDTSITYQVSDGEGGISMATVTFTVTGLNDAPVPHDPGNPGTPPADPNAFIPEQPGTDSGVATPLDVTQYAADPDGSDTLTFTLDPAELPPGLTFDGTTISGTYDADASQGGPAGDGVYPVTLTVSDGHGGSFTTTITFDVSNPPPAAQDDAVAANEDNVLGGDVFANNGNGPDSDPDGDAFTVTAVGGSAPAVGAAVTGTGGGSFTINANGSYSFDPGTDFNGLDVGETATTSITYTITDADGASDTATITVTVEGRNDGPVVIDPLDPGAPDNPNPASDPLNIIPDVSTTDGATPAPVNVGSYIVDPDGEPLTFTAAGLPPGMVSIPPRASSRAPCRLMPRSLGRTR
jgi:VCBS repeat-containing protein